MTENHPITPPPELVEQWWAEETYDPFGVAVSNLAAKAAQWGANQELEAVIDLAGQSDLPEEDRYFDGFTVAGIRANRRPKPPTLKEQALAALRDSPVDPVDETLQLSADVELIIRRALEALDD
jgi:hypothetical protein